MPRRIIIGDEQLQTAWHYYSACPTISTAAIAAFLGMHVRTLQRRSVEWGWPPREQALGQGDAGEGRGSADPPEPPLGLAAVAQALARSVRAEIGLLDALRRERRGDPEQTARLFASLAKTLAAAQNLQAEDVRERQEARSAHDDDGEPPPRSLEELRDELARHLDRIVADEEAAGSDDFRNIARACKDP